MHDAAPEPRPTEHDPPLSRRQIARAADFHRVIYAFYGIDGLFLLGFGLLGAAPMWLWWAYPLAGASSATLAVSRFQRGAMRRRDVDRHNLVLSACAAAQMLLTAWLVPAVGGLLLMTLVTVLASTALQVARGPLVAAWVSFAAAAAALVATSDEALGLPMATLGQRLVTSAWFAWVLAKGALVNVEGTRLRRQLGDANARLRQARDELARMATTDELTVIPNRRSIASALHGALARAPGSVAVALFDIDLFKAVNDRHGHATGDAVLVEFASLVSAGLRPGDQVGRFGGEEFLLVLKDVGSAAVAMEAAGRIRRSVEAHGWCRIAPDLRITASAGVAIVLPDESGSDAIARADAALYAAKAGGRNRVVLGDAAEHPARRRTTATA